MSYANVVASDQRLVILQALEEDADYSHNEHVLRSVLSQFGHSVSRDRLRTELNWLSEQGLVSVAETGGIHIAKLTARGEDVARGRARVPGVARPRLS
ncbi:MAG: hypothetical protein WED00_05745 [Aquisalimonadaceae bacterium]